MPKFKVVLQRWINQTADVDVEADDEAGAFAEAESLYQQGVAFQWHDGSAIRYEGGTECYRMKRWRVALFLIADGRDLVLEVEAASARLAVDDVVDRLGFLGGVDGKDFDSGEADVVEIVPSPFAFMGGAS